jgi:steroid 5-alpha reductase family enzyme
MAADPSEPTSFLDKKSGPLILCGLAYSLALLAAIWVGGKVTAVHPIAIAFWANIAATLVIFAFTTAFKNTSLYDPYWSVQPPLLAIYWLVTAQTYGASWRAGIVIFLVAFWSFRLTFNCFRRWQSLRHEDFRYTDYRNKMGKLYPLVDLFGMQMMPTLLVFLGSVPIYFAITGGAGSWNMFDVLAITVTTLAIALELIADEQLHSFLKTNKDPGKVLTSGLWSWSRHPNYVGEVLFWWGVYFFALAANPALWKAGFGALLITLLFVFISIPMMQTRKRERRPTYEAQVKGISVFFPRPPK